MLQAVRDVHELTVTFQLPCLFSRYQCKADEYIEHLVGHEGRGSLLSLLKRRGWATELSAGVGEGGYDRSTVGFLFDISVTLTDEGLRAAPGACVCMEVVAVITVMAGDGGGRCGRCGRCDHCGRCAGCGLAVVGVVFEYLALLANVGPQRCALTGQHGMHGTLL